MSEEGKNTRYLNTTTSTSKEFTHKTKESTFTSRHHSSIHTITVYSLHAADGKTTPSWLTAAVNGTLSHQLRHPLNLSHHPYNLPTNFDLSKLGKFTFIHSIFHNVTTNTFDKLLVVPTPTPTITLKLSGVDYYDYYNNINLRECNLFALYDGGQLRACPCSSKKWVRVLHGTDVDKFDDIVICRGNICVLDRKGKLYQMFKNLCIGRTLIDHSFDFDFGWRKRLVVDEQDLYLVVRAAENTFQVYKWVENRINKREFHWEKVRGFDRRRMLFIAKDYCFFWPSWDLWSFRGRELQNCIMFSEKAFPKYGNDCWEVTNIGRPFGGDEDVAVFWLDDGTFVREGENDDFSKLNWQPPAWIIRVWSDLDALSQSSSSSEFCSKSEREPEEEDGLDSNSKDEEQQEMESDSIDQDKEQEEMECDSDSRDQDGKMQCDLNSQENEEEAIRSLLIMNGRNDSTQQGTSIRNTTESISRACTPCTTKCHKPDSATVRFEGLDIRSDLLPTLKKIWENHGNITENSIVRNGEIIARALEALASMVRILEDNLAQSLSDSQADYLTITLSDLISMRFKVYWLAPFVEKVLKLSKSKPLLDSLNDLSQLSSQVEERKSILLDELAKLNEEGNKLKEKMATVSGMIPFFGQVKFNEPVGAGLT